MMSPGEERIVADRLYTVLSAGRKSKGPVQPRAAVADLTGEWFVQIEYVASTGEHAFFLKQEGNRLVGTHHGEYLARELVGIIDGDSVKIRSSVDETVVGNALTFTFNGKITEDTITGDLDMGEYLAARWSAKRRQYRDRA
jgi:L-seryl-tRNA(Ser) seleniumtransferase